MTGPAFFMRAVTILMLLMGVSIAPAQADHASECDKKYKTEMAICAKNENQEDRTLCESAVPGIVTKCRVEADKKEIAFLQQNPHLISAQSIREVFAEGSRIWTTKIEPIARTLFFSLVIFELVLCFGMMALRSASLEEFATELIRRVIILGFGLFILNNFHFLYAIIQGFEEASNIVQGKPLGDSGDLQYLLEVPFEVIEKIWTAMTGLSLLTDPGSLLMFAVAAALVLWALATAGVQLILVLCEAYIVITIGLLTLGLYSFQSTREYPMRFFGALIGTGFKIFTLNLIIALGVQMAQGWVDMRVVHSPLPYLGLAVAALMYKEIAVRIPDYIQGVLSGAPGSGISASGAVAGGLAVVGAGIWGSSKAAGGGLAVRDAAVIAASQPAGFGGVSGFAEQLLRGAGGAAAKSVRGMSPLADSMSANRYEFREASFRSSQIAEAFKTSGSPVTSAPGMSATPPGPTTSVPTA